MPPSEQRLDPIDYDLHGVVGIRLVDATPADARAVARQLGPLRRPLGRPPDIVIRFVDGLTISSPIRYLGADTAAFTDDAFLVLRSKHKAKARVRIPFERVGGHCEIVCESGLPAIPLLIPIVNLTALQRGVAPLHASAFVFRDTGVLVTGWSKGGKTEALLAFMARGATYLGDEWIYVDPYAGQMFGIPQPIRLWDWHLAQCQSYAARIGWAKRARLRTIGAAVTAGGRLADARWPGGQPGSAVGRLNALMKQQAYVDVAPERLFGPCTNGTAPIDRVFLLASRAAPGMDVEAIDAADVARRMVYSVLYELAPFMSYYLMARFAFPFAANERLDAVEDDLRTALRRGLQGRPAHVVYHPYPLCLATLFDTMLPLV